MAGILSKIGEFFLGKPDVRGQEALLTPQQTASHNQLLEQMQSMGQPGGNYAAAQNYLSNLLNRDPGTYDRFAAPYLQQFEQNIIPQLAERFAGYGGGLGGGALGSSGFAQAAGGAGAQLQANLANLFANLQRGAATEATGQYNQLANMGLGTRAFTPTYQPGTTGFLGQVGQGLGQGLGQLGGFNAFNQLASLLGGGIGRANQRSGIEDTITGALATGPSGQGASSNPYTGYQGY